jgi:hypothetical protein
MIYDPNNLTRGWPFVENYRILFSVLCGQLDLLLIFLESVRTFSRILDPNKISLAFGSQLDFFMEVLLLTRKESFAVSYMCVCLAIWLHRKKCILNKCGLTNKGDTTLGQLTNHQHVYFFGIRLTQRWQKEKFNMELVFCIYVYDLHRVRIKKAEELCKKWRYHAFCFYLTR